MSAIEPLLQIVDQAKAFGFRDLANGAKLFGHVPHVAPEAWLHQLYAPLSNQALISLEEAIGQTIPTQFRDFLEITNGLGLFSCSLSIYGKRTSYVRSGDDAWQPFCLVTANTLERPKQAKPWHLILGGYRYDGSLLLLDGEDGSVLRTKGRSIKALNRWQNLWAMLQEEATRLSGLFDGLGHKLSEGPTTPSDD